mmetsp:Transcript_51254/g.147993  ORF Transcript_51254/g.147993 Transcript_51254/m.147993 type:complete len:340 (-) Transcript_51254:143-1162(-)
MVVHSEDPQEAAEVLPDALEHAIAYRPRAPGTRRRHQLLQQRRIEGHLLVWLNCEGAPEVADAGGPTAGEVRWGQGRRPGRGHNQRLLRVFRAPQLQIALPKVLGRHAASQRREVVVAGQQRHQGEVPPHSGLIARRPRPLRQLRYDAFGEDLGIPDCEHRPAAPLPLPAVAAVQRALADDAHLPRRALHEGEEEDVRVAADDDVRLRSAVAVAGDSEQLGDDLVLALADGVRPADRGRPALGEGVPPAHAACGVILEGVADLRHEGHAWREHVVGHLLLQPRLAAPPRLALALALGAALGARLRVLLEVRAAPLPLCQALRARRRAVDGEKYRLPWNN